MHRHQLALEVDRQFGHLQVVRGERAGDLVAITLALRGERQIDEAAGTGRELQALVAQARRPRPAGCWS